MNTFNGESQKHTHQQTPKPSLGCSFQSAVDITGHRGMNTSARQTQGVVAHVSREDKGVQKDIVLSILTWLNLL